MAAFPFDELRDLASGIESANATFRNVKKTTRPIIKVAETAERSSSLRTSKRLRGLANKVVSAGNAHPKLVLGGAGAGTAMMMMRNRRGRSMDRAQGTPRGMYKF